MRGSLSPLTLVVDGGVIFRFTRTYVPGDDVFDGAECVAPGVECVAPGVKCVAPGVELLEVAAGDFVRCAPALAAEVGLGGADCNGEGDLGGFGGVCV